MAGSSNVTRPTFQFEADQPVTRLARPVHSDGTNITSADFDGTTIVLEILDRDSSFPATNLYRNATNTTTVDPTSAVVTATKDDLWAGLDDEGYTFSHTVLPSQVRYDLAAAEGDGAANGWRPGRTYIARYTLNFDAAVSPTIDQNASVTVEAFMVAL